MRRREYYDNGKFPDGNFLIQRKNAVKRRSQRERMINMKELKALSDTMPGEVVTVKELLTRGSMRRRLIDIGLTENTEVKCVGRSPFGDPSAYMIRGAVIAIRREDSGSVLVAAT